MSVTQVGAEMCLLGRRAVAQKVDCPIPWLAADEASYVIGSVRMGDGGQFTKRDKGRRQKEHLISCCDRRQ
jgi:hypothetical protein